MIEDTTYPGFSYDQAPTSVSRSFQDRSDPFEIVDYSNEVMNWNSIVPEIRSYVKKFKNWRILFFYSYNFQNSKPILNGIHAPSWLR